MQQTFEKGVRAKASKIRASKGTEDKQAEGHRRSSSEGPQNCVQAESRKSNPLSDRLRAELDEPRKLGSCPWQVAGGMNVRDSLSGGRTMECVLGG